MAKRAKSAKQDRKQDLKSKRKVSRKSKQTETTARRARGKTATRAKTHAGRAAKTKTAARKQAFIVRHHKPNAFEVGLRRYAQYRDLGIAAATKGLARAHVIKMIPPCDPAEVSKRHFHDVEFQMVYVLRGWIKGEYEGAGEVTMREGSCWLQPPKIKHTVLDYSDDCELLEIIMPADFETVELE